MNKHLSNRRGVWYFRVPTRLRKLAGKELERIGVIAVADARRYRDRRLRELSLLSLLPQQQGTLPPKKTLRDALDESILARQHQGLRMENIRSIHRWISANTDTTIALSDIDRSWLHRLIDLRMSGTTSPATCNRMLEQLRYALNLSAELGWVETAMKIKMLEEHNERNVRLSREQAQVLLSHLPPHLEAMARFSLQTGLRASNVRGLLWSEIDLGRRQLRIHSSKMKARRDHTVDLTETAIRLIEAQMDPRHHTHVFTYRTAQPKRAQGYISNRWDPAGRPMTGKLSTQAWHKALSRANAEWAEKTGETDVFKGMRWHDLRHVLAAWWVQEGKSDRQIMQFFHWRTRSMVDRYAALRRSDVGDLTFME